MTAAYRARADAHAARRDVEAQRSLRLSRARLAVFLVAAAVLVWTLGTGATPLRLGLAAALFAVFGVLVVRHARVDDRVAWHDALRRVCLHAAARVERQWDALPPGDPPPGVDVSHHAYAFDLDLFGRASLFQWLGPSATPGGAATLASWLLGPAAPDVIRARQEAGKELAALDEWRERLAAHGVRVQAARQPEIDAFVQWAEGSTFLPSALRAVVLLLTGSIWLLFALFMLDVTDGAFWLLPMVAGIVLSFALSKRLQREFDRAGAGQRALGRYAALFEHATSAPFASAAIRDITARLSAEGRAAPACMRALNRIVGFAELHTGAALLHFPIQAFTLWDFHVAFALEKWRRAAGRHLRGWMQALGELDALSSLAGARSDNPQWCVPELHDSAVLAAEELAHPLLGDDRRVPNDVQIGPPRTLLLVTGSNMSGKSTLLRAIGLNVVLAQAGGSACARRLVMPPCDLETSIRVQDSLELGLSYFMAALARLKGVVDAAERSRTGRVVLYLLDEILQGTNSAERSIAVRAVARHLLEAGSIGAMTTHDLTLAGEEPLVSSATLVHFTEIVDEDGRMRFDYRLRDGLATSRNALRLMQMIGIDLKEP